MPIRKNKVMNYCDGKFKDVQIEDLWPGDVVWAAEPGDRYGSSVCQILDLNSKWSPCMGCHVIYVKLRKLTSDRSFEVIAGKKWSDKIYPRG